MKKCLCFALLLSFFVVKLPVSASAMELALSFDEVVRKADLIFMGEVVDKKCRYTAGTKKKMILTDYTFLVKKVIYSKKKVDDSTITITFAGGKLDKEYVVTGVPTLENGGNYILFLRHDGKVYANPVIGGTQGFYRIVTDDATGISYPLRNGTHPITGVEGKKLRFGPRTERVREGVAEAMPEKPTAAFYDEAPTSASALEQAPSQPPGRDGSAAGIKVPPAATVSKPRPDKAARIMTVEEFINEIGKRIKNNGR